MLYRSLHSNNASQCRRKAYKFSSELGDSVCLTQLGSLSVSGVTYCDLSREKNDKAKGNWGQQKHQTVSGKASSVLHLTTTWMVTSVSLLSVMSVLALLMGIRNV